MISRDWLRVKTELKQLRSGDAEHQDKVRADDEQPRLAQSASDDALMRHIADALRGNTGVQHGRDKPRS